MSERQPNPQPDPQAALRAALAAANRRATEASSRAATLEQQLRGETQGRFQAQETAIDNAITAATSESETLSERWAALQAEGNFAEAGKVMRQMSETTARLDRFKAQKDYLAGQRETAAQQPASTDPLAQYSNAEKDWIAENPRYLSDPAFKRRVDAAAMSAVEFDGAARDTPEFFQAIERKIYPERFQNNPAPAGDTGAQGAASAAGDPEAAVGDDPTADIPAAEDLNERLPEQHHNRPAETVMPTTEPPVMRISADSEQPAGDANSQPQPRAVGRGGAGMRAVAAPPSRRIVEVSNRLARGGRIEPTMEELLTARALAQSIEPEVAARGDEEIVRWYHALYHSPSHRLTKRRAWAVEGVA